MPTIYIPRKLESSLANALEAPEIIAVLGPRQSGKTTMVQKIMAHFSKGISISFEDQQVLAMFEQNPDDFIAAYIQGNRYLFIDEFQYAKNGGKILKYIFDTQKIKIIISGSSAADITVQAVRHLVGRILIFHLYPFNFQEFLAAKDINFTKLYERYKTAARNKKPSPVPPIVHAKLTKYYEEYLLFGGYPRVVTEKNIVLKKTLLQNIYNTYLLREVRDILGLIDDFKLHSLIKALALQIGNLVEYQELSQISGFSYPALKKYLNFLEKTYVCRFVKPFYSNKRTEIVKNPKVFFVDTGLRNAIADDFRKLQGRTDQGALLENGPAMEYIKSEKMFYFWRDKKHHEIDFVVELSEGEKKGIEIKKYLRETRFSGIESFRIRYPKFPVILGFLEADIRIRGEKNCLPVYLL